MRTFIGLVLATLAIGTIALAYEPPTDPSPAYAGPTECSQKDQAECEKTCIGGDSRGGADPAGNLFLQVKCSRVDHAAMPESKTRYGLRCECNWIDYGWDDPTVANPGPLY